MLQGKKEFAVIMITLMSFVCSCDGASRLAAPPEPKVVRVISESNKTTVAIDLCAKALDFKFLQKFKVCALEVDGAALKNNLPVAGPDDTGFMVITFPVEAASKIVFGGVLQMNGRRYELSCSLSSKKNSWTTDRLTVRKIPKSEWKD